MKTTYKLFKKRKDGTIGPLYINRKRRIPIGEWVEAEDVPTKGYAHRPGWHTTLTPEAPHISEKEDRVWYEVQIKNYYEFERPKYQGGVWLISKWLKVNKELK